MILRKLSTFGFKSFADKSEVNFGEGITAIVGPNGCGKSNVVDAIRWVLGEQKASSLRSTSMQDVIFSGTQKRQPLNFAEVTLTIENNKGILPIEYQEVGITRRVFRSGESEYMLNRVPCRLRDINNLFLDTGIGSNAYTTIENSMINSILSDKAEERRILFEEAAGIGKYKQRRKESERKLEFTRTDLLRLSDKIQDKEQDVKVLARQVEKAHRYRKWYDELRDMELGYEARHYRELNETMAQRRELLSTADASLETVRAKIATEESRIESMNLQAMQKETEVQNSGQTVAEIGETIITLDKEASLSNETLKHLDENTARFDEEYGSIDAQMVEKRDLRGNIEKGIVDAEAQLALHKEELLGIQENLARFDRSLSQKKLSTDELASEQIRIMHAIGDQKNIIGSQQTTLRNAMDLQERHEKELAALTAHSEENTEKLEDSTQQLRSACEQHQHLMNSRDALVARIEKEDERYRDLLAREKHLEAKIDTCKQQLEFLKGLDSQREGYENGVKALLAGENPGRLGIVADLINVADEKAAAIADRALGQEIQTVVFRSDSDLHAAIERLTSEQVGTARMISMERMTRMAAAHPAHDRSDSVCLRQYVQTSDEFTPLADHLFNRVLVAKSRQEAMELSLSLNHGTIVTTEDGLVCRNDGTVVAGSAQKASVGLLARRQRLDTLPAEVETLRKELSKIMHDKEISIITRDEAKVALAEVNEKLSTGQRKQQEQETNIKHYQKEMETISEKLEIHRTELAAATARIEELERSVSEAQQKLEQLQDARAVLERQVEDSKVDVTSMETNRHAITERLTDAQLRIQGLTHKVAQNQADIASLSKDIDRLESRKQQLVENKEATHQHIAELKERMTSVIEELASRRVEREMLQSDHAVIREQYNHILNDIDEIRKQVKEERLEMDQLSTRVFELRNEETRAEEKMRALREKIFEAYKIDLQSPPEDVKQSELPDAEIEEAIRTYKERLSRLNGQVNMAAPEEYETKNKELQEFLTQRNDLQAAVDDLETAIKKLNKEARLKFVETFELVRGNFTQLFTTLFEGGEVHLSLEENVDPLEAAININVRPAGKKMRGVSLLSGGERALTAISLLFALYKVKPSAYCILDELDAPLDEANIGRFVRIVKDFSQSTQFIIITHNKRTMEAADALYGVTHQEQGVSTVVSVMLEEAMRHAA
jgi:chromosome segregation protein